MARRFNEKEARNRLSDALDKLVREDIDEIEDYLGIYGIGWNEAPGLEKIAELEKNLIDGYIEVLRWLFKHRDKSCDDYFTFE